MKGGAFVNLQLLDHLIISAVGYFSFLDEGLLGLREDAECNMRHNLFTGDLQSSMRKISAFAEI